ncbi:MAG TPA: BamA/TamA family outer membrane protein [Pyrinomonadaceae bacterium]|nr:BamA/TamA family outer membrane protein [Pyrinomonadaceae bacterium]
MIVLCSALKAQAPSPSPSPSPSPLTSPPPAPAVDSDQTSSQPEKRGRIVAAPIPIVSPVFGTGLVGVFGYVFKMKMTDTKSRPSTVGAVGAFTNNGTRGLLVGARLYFAENKYQTTMRFGKGKAVAEFFGIGRIPGRPPISTRIEGRGTFFFGEFMRNVGWDTFIGPRYQYRSLNFSRTQPAVPGGFEIPPIDVHSTSAAIGFHVQRDTRDSTFYPRKGTLLDVEGNFFSPVVGSRRTYQTYKIAYNGFRSLGDKQVLAYRGMVCAVNDRTPFYDLCFYGSSDLRGYTAGQYQNNRSFAAQAEYRRELPWRLGIVAFAGLGGIADRFTNFNSNHFLPAAGIGIRYKLEKKNHINYRVDFGVGRSGTTLTMSVGEAF